MKFSDLVENTLKFKKSASCVDCPIANSIFVPPHVNQDCEVLLIGEAPGKTEVAQRVPFVGTAGKLLKKSLEDAGFDISTMSVTNIVKCRPYDEKGATRTPTKKEFMKCGSTFIDAEVSSFGKLKVVILLGKSPFDYFFPKGSYAKSRGHFLKEGGKVFFVSMHPSHALYNPNKETELANDMLKVKEYLDNKLFSGRSYHFVDNIASLEACKADLLAARKVAIDIETPPIPDERLVDALPIKCFTICTQKDHVYGFYFECKKTISLEYRKAVWALLKEILEDEKTIKIFHNAKFEYLNFLKRDCKVVNYRDTMLEAFLLDENREVGLKPLAAIYTKGYRNVVTDFKNVDITELIGYCAEDADLTMQLHETFYPNVKGDTGLNYVYKEILLPAVHVLATIEKNGVSFDVDYAQTLERDILAKIQVIEDQLYAAHRNLKFINLDSTKQLSDFLFNNLKVIPVSKTKGGQPALGKNDLIVFSERGLTIADPLLDRRKYKKQLTTYVKALPKLIGMDRRINSSYKLTGTVTGRLASANPNLQNIPRDKSIKNLIIAEMIDSYFEQHGLNKYCLLQGDFSQAELRIAASIANDAEMIRVYNTPGGDIHNTTGATVAGVSLEEVTKEMRQGAKAVNFGFIYGMEWEGFKSYAKFQYKVEFSDKDAKLARTKFFAKYCSLLPWHEKAKAFATKNGFILSPLGRKRRLPQVWSKEQGKRNAALRQAINSPVQGTASDLTVYTMIQAQKFLEKKNMQSKIVLTVHDSIIFSAHEKEVDGIIFFLMNTVAGLQDKFNFLRVPMVMDFEKGDRWGNLEKINTADYL